MANTKRFVVKNGLQTSNIDFKSPSDLNTITVSMLDSDVLSVSGNSGQLFSISDLLTGKIFAVNDISGIPSIEVYDTGKVQIAELFGNVLIGTATDDNTNKLQVNGGITHTGLAPTEGTNIDQIKTFTKSITMSTDWQDTGIKSTDLATGTYMIQLVANDISSGGTNNNEYYSGTLSWYSGDTNSALELPTDEITLHRAGGSGDGALYLRTYRTPTSDLNNLKLQIYSNTANASAANYVFKFRRII